MGLLKSVEGFRPRAWGLGVSSFQKRHNNRQSGKGRRLRAEDAWTERSGAPAIGVEERFFFRSPSSFRTNRNLEHGHLVLCGGNRFLNGGAKGRGAFLLGKHDARSV